MTQVDVDDRGDTTVVTVRGNLDMDSAPLLTARLDEVLARPEPLVGPLALAYARAFTAGDAAALQEAAADFEAIGMRGVAADASRQAQSCRVGG
jgi:hypothetical protein